MKPDKILLDHGAGGKASHELVKEMMLPAFNNPMLSCLEDGAVVDMGSSRLAFSTDSYVVDPIFFPGGSIGDLAVNGTVNDIAMCGAWPMYLSCGLIIEEGFPTADLKAVLSDMSAAADRAGVLVVTGDTKVVPKGAADKIFINTSGMGLVPAGVDLGGHKVQPGDKVIVSGNLADHGMTILTQRTGLTFQSDLCSDTAPLNHMTARLLEVAGDAVRVLRDPTRGGLGTSLNEIAQSAGCCIRIDEQRIPVRPETAGVCELLGFDPLYVANEGKLIAVVAPDAAEKALEAVYADKYGKDARIIGEVAEGPAGRVVLVTRIGGERIVDMLAGEQLPRIC